MEEHPPKISVIMPAYNAASTIKESIDSVLAQTYCDWELVIVDDCSLDSTNEIAEAVSDSRIFLIKNSTNLGVASSRNIGISKARGEWIAFLDSDDLWQPVKLERQLDFAKQTGAAITYTATAYIGKSHEQKKYILPAKYKLQLKDLLRRNIMTCSSVMVKKEHMQPFPQGFLHEDYAAWIEIVRKTECAYGLNEPLTVYRISETSKSYNRMKSARMNFNAYRHVGYGVFTAASFSVRYAVHSIVKRLRIRFGRSLEVGCKE